MEETSRQKAVYLDLCMSCGKVNLGWYPEGKSSLDALSVCANCNSCECISQSPALSTMN